MWLVYCSIALWKHPRSCHAVAAPRTRCRRADHNRHLDAAPTQSIGSAVLRLKDRDGEDCKPIWPVYCSIALWNDPRSCHAVAAPRTRCRGIGSRAALTGAYAADAP